PRGARGEGGHHRRRRSRSSRRPRHPLRHGFCGAAPTFSTVTTAAGCGAGRAAAVPAEEERHQLQQQPGLEQRGQELLCLQEKRCSSNTCNIAWRNSYSKTSGRSKSVFCRRRFRECSSSRHSDRRQWRLCGI
ncbi:unnamed protein product, partial [Pylaiella littoralis]